MQITPQELELLDAETQQKILALAQEREELAKQYEQASKVKSELQEFMNKVYSNPQLKQQFEQIVKQVDPNVELPKNPVENYIEPIKKEFEAFKQEQAKKELKARLEAKARQLGISPEEYTKVDELAAQKKILDLEAAMEYYAAIRDKSRGLQTSIVEEDALASVNTSKVEIPDINTAKQRAIEKIRYIQGGF
jgi:hypothetical protein